ncbi:MAG: hypothetical protein EXR54_03040 [Dehalococcoidia bacterium]|nr:hypothetical protein [Dehalococcoidia bacterium]MSQ16532.1 hypothetical protein [Dehalococcoidia bacterium]
MLWAVMAHMGEADLNLLRWIKDQLDHLLGLGPWTVVALLGLLVLLMPVSLVAYYLAQRRRTVSLRRRP